MNDGDWICSDANCGNINFSRRQACYRCNKERPDAQKSKTKKLGTEIGKTAAEKSRGLFNADDWQCNKCANVNWARRQTCNVCNAPKFGEVEARTGYGGGYNERGTVEYRRREPSSDDEYDEFGRKKRKRKADSEEKVGITEGAVFKKFPPTVLQKQSDTEHAMPFFETVMTRPKNKSQEKTNGSLSDGSVCEVAPLTKSAVNRYQQISQQRRFQVPPSFKTNGVQSRKRFVSTGEREQTASSGYETCSKKSRRDSTISPIIKSYNPVMENMVSSTNNDVVYKFTGPTPAEDFQVTYTVEERVKAAALAIVYKNCKISTEKFEAFYDKPAPDFKTIFAWRQRLLNTGCLVDSHVDCNKYEAIEKPSVANVAPKCNNTIQKPVCRVPNPDEIVIDVDSDDDIIKPQKSLVRSVSAETLVIAPERDVRAPSSHASTVGDRGSCGRSRSQSTHRRTHSSSRDSQDSNYPDTDSEKVESKLVISRPASYTKSANVSARISISDSGSDSVSYNSEDDNFLSRVFPNRDGRKRRRNKRRPPPTPVTVPVPVPAPVTQPPAAPEVSAPVPNTIHASKASAYVPNRIQPFQGYSTVKPIEKSPLVTGNIYTSNLRNMNVKTRNNIPVDLDNCSSEYVPTRVGTTTKQNYQQFKDIVRKKGYWAKGNGSTFAQNRNSISMDVTPTLTPTIINAQEEIVQSKYCVQVQNNETTAPNINKHVANDYKKSDTNTSPQYIQCNAMQVNTITAKPIPTNPICNNIKTPETVDRIFSVVQSNCTDKKRKSILDIFDNNESGQKSPDANEELEKCDKARKMFESQWDDDDDDLYKDSDCGDKPTSPNRQSSPPSTVTVRAQSPLSEQQVTPNKGTLDAQKMKQDMLLDLLKDFQNKEIGELISPLKQVTPPKPVQEPVGEISNQLHKVANLYNIPAPIPPDLSKEVLQLSEDNANLSEFRNEQTVISTSKKVHVLESITIQPGSLYLTPKQNTISKEVTNETANLESVLQEIESNKNIPEKPLEREEPSAQSSSHLDLSNLLAGINTNTLLLALQNLQQLTNNSLSDDTDNKQDKTIESNTMEYSEAMETINLTNDEDWEKESNIDGSIERQLEQLDGSTEDTPFLGDIFDPRPVNIPPNVARKLNLNLEVPEDNSIGQTHINEDAPVIGNFKSFALPKPILLNRLKLTVKTADKSTKKSESAKVKRKKKTNPGSAREGGEGGEEDDEEESGDEGDLSKYDLWGSDAEQGNSAKTDHVDQANSKDGDSPKEGESKSPSDKTERKEKSASPVNRSSKRRSRSSSTSSTSSSSSSTSQSSSQEPKNKFDDFNLNSERESSPKGRKSRSRSRSPRARSAGATRRKSRDSRSAGESRSHESSRDKEKSRDRDRRDRSRSNREERKDKERRYSREGGNHYASRGRHR